MLALASDGSKAGSNVPFVVSNLEKGKETVGPNLADFLILNAGKIKVGVVGIISSEAIEMVSPGNFGPMSIREPVAEAMRAQAAARKAGADIVVCLVHMGMNNVEKGRDTNRLKAFAEKVTGFATIFGDHTDVQYAGIMNGQLVLQSASFGKSYARTVLKLDKARRRVLSASVTFVIPRVPLIVPDAKITLMLDEYRAKLVPILSRVLATSPVAIPRSDACGSGTGRSCESLLGNVVADALRLYNVTGMDFSFTGSGGLCADLTCSTPGGNGYCPPNATASAPFYITRGAARASSPYDSNVVSVKVSGAQIKSLLEAGVAPMPTQVHLLFLLLFFLFDSEFCLHIRLERCCKCLACATRTIFPRTRARASPRRFAWSTAAALPPQFRSTEPQSTIPSRSPTFWPRSAAWTRCPTTARSTPCRTRLRDTLRRPPFARRRSRAASLASAETSAPN
jgi:2',3'-cyclic-nucleotide 2'-phosphodiesterase (5'-nucleotidase family)